MITDDDNCELISNKDIPPTLFVKENVSDGKFTVNTVGLIFNDWSENVQIVVRLTVAAFNYLSLVLQLKRETGLRVRLISLNNQNYVELTSPIGKFNRVISNLNDLNENQTANDSDEPHELRLPKWINLIPCESQPIQGYDPYNIKVRLTILYSALQKWSDNAMTGLLLPDSIPEFKTFELMFEFLTKNCLNSQELQKQIETLNPYNKSNVHISTLLLLGSIQIRLHTPEQIKDFSNQRKHDCLFDDKCPLNLIVKLGKIQQGRLLNVNSLLRYLTIKSFESLNDYEISHLNAFLELNLLIPNLSSLDVLRSNYFQLFERIAQISDLYSELPTYFKFPEVFNAQRFLSLLGK